MGFLRRFFSRQRTAAPPPPAPPKQEHTANACILRDARFTTSGHPVGLGRIDVPPLASAIPPHSRLALNLNRVALGRDWLDVYGVDDIPSPHIGFVATHTDGVCVRLSAPVQAYVKQELKRVGRPDGDEPPQRFEMTQNAPGVLIVGDLESGKCHPLTSVTIDIVQRRDSIDIAIQAALALGTLSATVSVNRATVWLMSLGGPPPPAQAVSGDDLMPPPGVLDIAHAYAGAPTLFYAISDGGIALLPPGTTFLPQNAKQHRRTYGVSLRDFEAPWGVFLTLEPASLSRDPVTGWIGGQAQDRATATLQCVTKRQIDLGLKAMTWFDIQYDRKPSDDMPLGFVSEQSGRSAYECGAMTREITSLRAYGKLSPLGLTVKVTSELSVVDPATRGVHTSGFETKALYVEFLITWATLIVCGFQVGHHLDRFMGKTGDAA